MQEQLILPNLKPAEHPERRGEVRQRVLKGAKLAFNRGYGALEGVVRNTSAHGAKIALGDTAALPHEFDVLISGSETWRRAHLRWRGLSEVGIALD